MNLGSETTNPGQCCSNFIDRQVAGDDETPFVCKLPVGTDLNVYFNRFVSGDGVDGVNGLDGLIDEDFNPTTGEPRLQNSTFQKIQALGETYCQVPATRVGAAFGEFQGEPNTGPFILEPIEPQLNVATRYTFVDSPGDNSCLLYTSPSPRDRTRSRMPSSA